MPETQEQQTYEPTQQFQPGERSQTQFDNIFGEQVFGDTATREVAQAYWAQAEDTLRQARRISEIYAMSLMQQHLIHKVSQVVVPQITQQVAPLISQQVKQVKQQVKQELINELRNNPSMLQPNR